MKTVPLVVDLDGTLVRTDMLIESLVFQMAASPGRFLGSLFVLRHGKAAFKEYLARGFEFGSEMLPLRPEVLALMAEARVRGSQLVLATGATAKIAERVSVKMGFSSVFSSTSSINFSGKTKAKALVEVFGVGGFDYVGNSANDLPVWQVARKAYCVGHNRAALRVFNKLGNGTYLEEEENLGIIEKWSKALRLHQWIKNLLIFVPAIAAHRVFEPGLILQLVIAFFAFALLSSSVYIINDVLDLQNDRSHPIKKHRPIANGGVSMVSAGVATISLLAISFTLALSLPSAFMQALMVYFVFSSLYSLGLKKVLILDVLILAGLFTLRVVAGGLAVEIVPSSWLLVFSFFIFLSLSFVKRVSEISEMNGDDPHVALGRAYSVGDVPTLAALGTASGMLSVLVFALYLDSPVVGPHYQSVEVLWGAVPILTFWLSFIWVMTGRGKVDQDPVLFVIKDKVSLVSAGSLLVVFLVAQSELFL